MKRSLLVGTVLAGLIALSLVQNAEAQRRGASMNLGGWGWNSGSGFGWNQPGYYGSGYNQGYGYNQYQPGYYGGNQYWGNHPYYSNNWNYSNPGYNNYSTPGYYSNQAYSNQGYTQPFNSGYASTDSSQFSFYSGPQGQNNDQAMVHVIVPRPDARVWLEGQEMQQQPGPERVFISPPLQRGSNFVYSVKAAWDDNGRQVTRERKVNVSAGQHVTVNFNEHDGQHQQGDRQQLQSDTRQQSQQQIDQRNRTDQQQTQPADQRNRQQTQPADQSNRPAQQQQPGTTKQPQQ